MINSIIVDDDEKALDLIETLLNNFCPNVRIQGKYSALNNAIKHIENNKTDVVFLDIEMTNETGFDLIEKLENLKTELPEVIFITGHEEYAIKAIKKGVIDYITKPVDPDELVYAVSNVTKKRKEKGINENKKIILKTRVENKLINVNQIIMINGNRNRCYIYINNGEELDVSGTIGDFENKLISEKFIRINKSTIINLMHLKKINGRTIVLSNNHEAIIPRNQVRDFKKRLI